MELAGFNGPLSNGTRDPEALRERHLMATDGNLKRHMLCYARMAMHGIQNHM